jgi:hypothetical protein
MRHAIPGACLVACAVALTGCEAPGNPPLAALVSPGGTYEVRLTGRVTRAGFFENWVRAEVYKNGVRHLPARVIYAAGLFDTAFRDRFGEPGWLGETALRFPPARPADGRRPALLHVRNVSSQSFRSIRIETASEMFLILDLAPGADFSTAMAPPKDADDPDWFDVLVDSGDDAAFMRGHGTFEQDPEPGRARTFVVTVSSNGVAVGRGDHGLPGS